AARAAAVVSAQLRGDALAPLRLRVAHLRVDKAIQQMRLPPVVPARKQPVLPRRRPRDHPELRSRHRPQSCEMTCGDRGFTPRGAIHPLLLHTLKSWLTKRG